MRVPVSPTDLDSQSGFKRIAKVLSRDWPGSKPLKLSLAREILAKAFGYSDYHDVTTEANTWSPGAPAPSVSEVRYAIEQELIKVGQDDVAMSITTSSLNVLVQSLPLHAVKALSATATLGAANPTGTSTNPSTSVLRLKAPTILDFSELQHIAQQVEQHGTLRDRALLSVLLSGMRASEAITMKAHQISFSKMLPEQPQQVMARLKTHRAKGIGERLHPLNTSLVQTCSHEALESYLSSRPFSPDDFLFPSATDTKKHMSYQELTRICARWSVLAKLKNKKITSNVFRLSVIAGMAAKQSTEGLTEMLGHTSPSSTLDYIRFLQLRASE